MITGASGVLGKEMIELLTKEKVLYMSLKSRLDNIDVNLSQIEEFKPNIFLHFGALKEIKCFSKDIFKTFYESNVLLTKKLYEKCKSIGCKFVYISTADLFERFGEPSLENGQISQNQKTITGGLYSWTKYLGEREIIIHNTNVIIFRSSTIYNKNYPSNFSCAKFLKNKNDIKNFIFQKNQFRMNFVRADLFARVIFKIIMRVDNRLKIYNFTSSFWVDNFEIVNLFAEKYCLKSFKNKDPINLPKRFNASNLILRNELGNDFVESNYLKDLKSYLLTKIVE